MELKSFETAITPEREDFFAFCFFVRDARGDVRSRCKKRVHTMSGKRPSTISSFPVIKIEVLNGKPHMQKGVKKIAVLAPSFFTAGLPTTVEINKLRAALSSYFIVCWFEELLLSTANVRFTKLLLVPLFFFFIVKRPLTLCLQSATSA